MKLVESSGGGCPLCFREKNSTDALRIGIIRFVHCSNVVLLRTTSIANLAANLATLPKPSCLQVSIF
jgi:hypothetical protein